MTYRIFRENLQAAAWEMQRPNTIWAQCITKDAACAGDDAEAVRWFRLACEQGLAQAGCDIWAGLYARVLGVRRDAV